MKTKIASCLLCITAGFLFASCEGGLSGHGVQTSSPDRSTQTIGQIPAEGGRKINVTETR